MKRFLPLMLVLVASCSSGCYSENKTIVEGGRPVEIQLRNMESVVKVALPKIDGCDYCYTYKQGNASFNRIWHFVDCEACTKHAWPDGQKPVESVEVRDVGTVYIYPLEINGCEYFTVSSWGSAPDDIVHRGHCKKCAKKRL